MSIYGINRIGDLLHGNSYVGRGIVIGKSENGKSAVFAYFIMGRSENSRNRIFTECGSEVIIRPFDESRVEDPSLIIYSPIKGCGNALVVTNGDQTDTIVGFLQRGKSFEEALETREFEPDAPNFTPRISGMAEFADGGFRYKMSILKSENAEGSECARYSFSYRPIAGLGHFIHTYNCDGNPIPTFTGEPERVAVPDDIDEFTSEIWNCLDADNRISLYVRYIDLETHRETSRMINKYEKEN